MKHFIINIKYIVPLSRIDEILPEHRKFLQTGYDQGLLLFSGPLNPRTGGIVAARSESIDQIKIFFQKDPYSINKCAEYEFTEFDPVKSQSLLNSWITGK
jgi:uncharacterized protein YciI